MVNTDLQNKIFKYMNTMTEASENINGDAKSKNLSNNVSTTYNDRDEQNQQEARINLKNKTTINSTVPKIIGNNVLPKGTIKIIDKRKINSQNNAFISTSKQSISILTLNNNMNEEDKHNGLPNKIINRNLNCLKKSKNNTSNMFDDDNETTVICENYVSNREQSNGLCNDEIREKNISQDSCSTEINYSDTLNKNTSNLMNENESCDNESLNIKKEKTVSKNRKRAAEENADLNYNRKKKLNRNSWLGYNGTLIEPKNQQCNDLTANDVTTTVQSNIVSKDEELKRNDLRNQLNLKRLKKTNIHELTFEKECNNKDIAIDTIIMTKEKTNEHCKNSKEELTTKEENDTQMNLHHDSRNNLYSLNVQSTEKVTNENINTENSNDIIDNGDDGDDCIFLFTDESFDESL